MQTSVQLAQRLLRYLSVKDLSQLPADDALHMLDAINGAIQEYYVLVPSAYKRTRLAGNLIGPQQITIGVTNGSTAFTGFTPTDAQIGFTIVIQTDSAQNMISGTSANPSLLSTYTGTTGTMNATVYGDVIQMSQVLQRITNDPVCLETNQKLIRDEQFRQRSPNGWYQDLWWGWYYSGTILQRTVGAPIIYWIESYGQSQGGTPPFRLRVGSLPDQNYRLWMDGDEAPIQLVFGDLTVPANLPLDYYTIESCVLPLAAERLIISPLWANAKLVPFVQAEATKARALTSERPSNQGASRNSVLTPAGW